MTENAGFDDARIRTVVLVGRQDFGRCALAARLPVALWPIAGKPAVERLLCHLADEGVQGVALCCDSTVSGSVGAIEMDRRLTVRLVVEQLSSGTAGCLRDAVASDPGDLIVVFSGSMVRPPSIRDLIDGHMRNAADLTAVFNPDPSGKSAYGTSAEIYLCRPNVLRLIPAGGYSDLKEGLIPMILRAGGVVKPMVLSQDVGNFHDRAGYLHAVSLYLENERAFADGYTLWERSSKRLSSVSGGGCIDSGARIYGPVAVSEGAYLARGAVVVGPAVLDRGTRVGEDSVVVESVLWTGSQVGARCEVHGSVVARDAVISDGSIVAEQTVPAGQKTVALRPLARKAAHAVERRTGPSETAGGNMRWLPTGPGFSQRQFAWALGFGSLILALLWSYWPVLQDLSKEWQRSDEYSAGLLVPFLAVYVLWTRRQDLASVPIRPMLFWGVAIFVISQAMRLFGLFWMYGSAERLSIIVVVTALILLLFGWRALRRVTTVLMFLCLMLPWPHRVQAQISLPLQGWATDSAVYCLELAGYNVLRDGNVIGIGQTNVAVAEACNGLRMVTAFLVISALVVLLVQRTWWEKVAILLSSLPIALLCNTLRLAITAVAFTVLKGDNVQKLFHDFGGYAMMPVALALVVGEFWLLGRLISSQAEVKPAVIVRRRTQHAVDS